MDRTVSPGLDLAPFRGLRYDPSRVRSLAAVTSPPYDVVEPDGVLRLEDADPHNVVRIVLPREDACEDCRADGRYAHAGRTLRRWLAEGVLRAEERTALYVYEQRTATTLQRGLIGALHLDSDVLPHEDVMPELVADRVELMRRTWANPEPILLAYRGGKATSETVDGAATQTPLLATRTVDGTSHRLWAVTDPRLLERVTADLRTRKALIADGHHRWAAYQGLRAENPGHPATDRGLVLLVDTGRYPLQVGAIHRVLPKLPVNEALDRLRLSGPPGGGAFLSRPVDPHLPSALQWLNRTPGPAFLLVAAGSMHLVSDPDPGLIDDFVRRDRPAAWRGLDATVLHSVLLDHVWSVPDDPEHIEYVHDAAAAVRLAYRTGGVAVLLRPTTESVVRELAEDSIRMPRKSTSFGPKPATGLVLRQLDH